MSSNKTPKRLSNQTIHSPQGFSPITLQQSPVVASPQKNLTGLPRIVRDLAADIYNTIQKWNDFHIQGANIVKQIASIKADDAKDYSPMLEQLLNALYATVKNLNVFKEQLATFPGQIDAAAKLQKQSVPLFISRDTNSLANLIREIINAYVEEFQVKEFVLENIAHSRDKNEAMFYAALWTYQYKITDNINLKLEILLVETGHRKFS